MTSLHTGGEATVTTKGVPPFKTGLPRQRHGSPVTGGQGGNTSPTIPSLFDFVVYVFCAIKMFLRNKLSKLKSLNLEDSI